MCGEEVDKRGLEECEKKKREREGEKIETRMKKNGTPAVVGEILRPHFRYPGALPL